MQNTMPGLLVDKFIEISVILPPTRQFSYETRNLFGVKLWKGDHRHRLTIPEAKLPHDLGISRSVPAFRETTGWKKEPGHEEMVHFPKGPLAGC